MMMLLTSGQIARGDLRRSAFAASQAISPWRPSARKASSASPARRGGSALAKRTAAKPMCFASFAIRSFNISAMTQTRKITSPLKIEVGVGPGRDEAGDAVGKQWPERRPRLEQRKPALHRLVVLPEHLAEIIECRKMCGGGKVGEARRRASKPWPGLGEMAEIGKMIAQIFVACPDRRDVWRAPVRVMAAIHFLVYEIDGHLVVELAMKPVDQASRLGARQGLAGEKAEAASFVVAFRGFVEILGDGVSTANRTVGLSNQHRQRACRVHLEKAGAPFPGLLLGQSRFHAAFRQRQANRAGEGTERIVQECRHRPVRRS